MDKISIPQAPTREERGIALYREHTSDIEWLGQWTWKVPSCTGTGAYIVNLRTEVCSCDDAIHAGRRCKHLYAARIAHAGTASCAGCGGRCPRRELIELTEGNHDNLTYFHGDRLCTSCADGAGVMG